MLEMGEYECCSGDLADFAGPDGDVLEGEPPFGEQGEVALAQAAQDRSRELRVRVLMSSSEPSAGCLTGVCTP